MTPVEQLRTTLGTLSLTAIDARLEGLLESASKKEPSYADFLLEVMNTEADARRQRYLKARLQLAAYDEEEYGLVGSCHHSGQLTSPVNGMISLEMLGYTDRRPGGQQLPPHLKGLYPDVGDFIGVVGNEASRPLLEAVTAAMKRVEGLPVQSLAVPGDGTLLPVTRLSDHASFWDRGLAALMVTDTSFFRNPHYHEPTDAPDTLDYPFLAKVTAGVCLAIWDLLTG